MSKERLRLNPHQSSGLTQTHRREYNSWNGARYRCQSEKHPAWEDYGGRGIAMCERWSSSFAAFVEDMGRRPEGSELDRIDNDGNYEPGNCRWVARAVNASNKLRRVPKPKPDPSKRVMKKISSGDQRRLDRVRRIDARYDAELDKLKQKVAQIEAEKAAKRAPIIEAIRPQFRPI